MSAYITILMKSKRRSFHYLIPFYLKKKKKFESNSLINFQVLPRYKSTPCDFYSSRHVVHSQMMLVMMFTEIQSLLYCKNLFSTLKKRYDAAHQNNVVYQVSNAAIEVYGETSQYLTKEDKKNLILSQILNVCLFVGSLIETIVGSFK